MTGTVYFIGAGPGAPDLLTVRAERLIRSADVVIYADSLVHPDVAKLARPDARVEASSRLTLEQMSALTIESALAGLSVARLQSGDPSLYGALHEQLGLLKRAGVAYEIVPGVSSAFAAAALLGAELTVPGVSQSIIFTRAQGRTGPLPPGEELRQFASHRTSLALFLSGALLKSAVPELVEGGYPAETPAALVYRATWEDEQIIRGTLESMPELAHAAGMTKQVLLMIGQALDPALLEDAGRRSHLYNPGYSHGRRVARRSEPADTDAPVQGATLPRRDARTAQPMIVAVSQPGRELADRLVRALPGARVAHPDANDGGVRALLGRLWTTERQLILVMAVGAAVRLIAPFLTDKRQDPGVVVVDDAGKFCVSLIGGHRSEANELAEQVAGALDATAVSTTAAEALGLPSVEGLARANGWIIENDGAAMTALAAAIVNGQRFGVVSREDPETWWTGPRDQVTWLSDLAALAEAKTEYALVVSDELLPRRYASNLDRWVMARPRSVVLGVGCSSGAPQERIEALITEALMEAGLSPLGVASLATIDRKAHEPALVAISAERGWLLRTFSAAELSAVSVPTPSEVVREAVGTPSVCEAAAMLASGCSSLALTKRSNEVATVAIARARGVDHGE